MSMLKRRDDVAATSAIDRIQITLPFSLYLDCVRVLAAILVVLAHFRLRQLMPAGLIIDDLGHESVIVFFVLSGIVIRSTAADSGAAFALGRATRLYSVVLPCILISYLAAYIIYTSDDRGAFSEFFAESGAFVGAVTSLAFLNDSWFSWNDVPANEPYWSLCYEAWYYALFGCWAYLSGRLRLMACALVALIAGPRILLLMPIWWLGVWIAQRQNGFRKSSPSLGWLMMITGVIGVLAVDHQDVAGQIKQVTHGMMPELWVLRHSELFLADYLVAGCVLVNFVGFKLVEGDATRFWLALKAPVQWISKSTFSIYLFHFPLVLLAERFVGPVSDAYLSCALFIGVILVCVMLSYVSERQKKVFEAMLTSILSFLSGKLALIKSTT